MSNQRVSETLYSTLSELFNGNVFPLVRPSNKKENPYLVYTILNTNPEVTIQGYTGYELAFVQIDIYTDNYDTCEDLTNRTINLLNQSVKPFHYENRKYLHEPDTGLFRQKLECHLWQTN